MAEDCPTGILLDFSEPTEIPSESPPSSVGWNSVSVDSKQCNDYLMSESPWKGDENSNVSNEFDCDFIENETLNDLSACSTKSSSHSEDDVLPIIWSPDTSKRRSRKTIKDDLSIGQRVEVFKEATCIAMHLENLSRGTPPPKPFRSLFTSPLIERNLYNNVASSSNKHLESTIDLNISSKVGTEEKKLNSETANTISFRPPLFAKPEARVQPILKSKIKETECTSENLSLTLRINKNKAMAAMTSSSKPSGPMKAMKYSPLKQSGKQQKVVAKDSLHPAKKKTPLQNSKAASGICTPLKDQSTMEKRNTTLTRSSSFGADPLRTRRQTAMLSSSFTAFKPAVRSQTPDRLPCPPQSSKTNSKSFGRRLITTVYSTPVQPYVPENSRPVAEPSTGKRQVLPTLRMTPHTASHLTPLKRSNSTSGDVPKKNVTIKRRSSIGGSSPKKMILPTPRMLTGRLRSSVLK